MAKDEEIAMVRLRRVFATFLLMLAVFGATHLLSYPGSVAYFKAATGGQKILDMQPSVSAEETYQRLQAMGEVGRELYLRLMLTVDIVFPLAMLIFLFALAQFAAERAKLKGWRRTILLALPLVYWGFDSLENVSAAAMLLRYPDRVDWLGGAIGYLTKSKRAFMMLAFVAPHVLLAVVSVRAWWGARRDQAARATV
jgi:hypothetical protein